MALVGSNDDPVILDSLWQTVQEEQLDKGLLF